MDIVEKLSTRADWHKQHKVTGPAYCYTDGDQAMDINAADEITRLRAEVVDWKDRWQAERQDALAAEKAYDRMANERDWA
jgi:hypothetical protein